MYFQVQLGMFIKQRQKPLTSLCRNALQKGGGIEGLLHVLGVFILPATNSGSLENAVKQGFDTSCTSWPVMLLFNPVILTILKHLCTMPKSERDFIQPACPCAFQPHFWLLCWCTHHLDWELQTSDFHLKSNKNDNHLTIQCFSSKCIQLKHFCCSKNALTSREQMKAF